MKKILIIFLAIISFNITTFATKKENKEQENLNSINIISEKTNTEKNIIKILDNIKKFKNLFDYDNGIDKLKKLSAKITDINNSFSDVKKALSKVIISYNTTEIVFLEKYIINLMSVILSKEEISLAASSLNSIKKSAEYKNIDENLQKNINIFLKEHYENCFNLRKYMSNVDKIFKEKNLEIISVLFIDKKNISKLKNKEKPKQIKKLLQKELDLLKLKRNLMCYIEEYINKFSEFYDNYVESKFNYKITEEFKIFLKYLFEIIEIEKIGMHDFNSLIEIITNNNFKLTSDEIDKLKETNEYFYKIKEIDNKKQDILNIINSPITTTFSAKEKTLYEIDKFFQSFSEKPTIFFLENIKAIKNSLSNVDINLLEEMKDFEKNEYDGETITQNYSGIENIKIHLTNIKNFNVKFKDPFEKVKNQIERLNMEKEYEKQIQKVENIFKDCEYIKQYYDIFTEIINDLKEKNKLKIEYKNKLEIPIKDWAQSKKIIEPQKENVEKMLNNLKCCSEEEIKNEISILEIILPQMINFYNNHIAYSKEKVEDCYNENTIKEFKNVVKEYHIYYNFLKKGKEILLNDMEKRKHV